MNEVPEEGTVAEQSQGIELKLTTGEVIKAATYEDALKVAVKMAEETKAVYHTEKEARERLEAQVADLSSQVQRQNAPPPPKPGDFNKIEYYRLLNEDPVEAQNFLDRHRFGQDPVQYFQRVDKQLTSIQGFNLAGQFLQEHGEEFPADEKNAGLFTGRYKQLVEGGYPQDMGTMELAWHQLTKEGTIKPLQKREEEHREEANPSLTGSGNNQISDEITKAENLPTAELEAYLKSKGML